MADRRLDNLYSIADNLDKEIRNGAINTRLDETIFSEVFIPYFSGKDNNSMLLVKWLDIAGSPFRPVDIIDVNGNVVDTAPAVMSADLQSLSKSDEHYPSTITKANLQEQHFPGSGERILSDTLKNELDNVRYSSKDWDRLIKKYGNMSTTPQPTTANKLNYGDDDLEIVYD